MQRRGSIAQRKRRMKWNLDMQHLPRHSVNSWMQHFIVDREEFRCRVTHITKEKAEASPSEYATPSKPPLSPGTRVTKHMCHTRKQHIWRSLMKYLRRATS